MSLLEKLKAGRKNIKTIKYPGTDINVAMQILSNQDIQDAIFAAEQYFKSRDIDISTTAYDAYEDERTTQILFRALKNPENIKETFASSVDELRKGIARHEKDMLVSEYSAFEQECSPQIEKMSDKDFEKLWEELKKNPESRLSSLNSGMQRRLILYLASRQQSLQKANGSIS